MRWFARMTVFNEGFESVAICNANG